jgi:hypothetical protein
MHARVYDEDDALVADDTGWNYEHGGGTLASLDPTFNARSGGSPLCELFNAGLNGLEAIEGASDIYMYQGAFAIRSDDWCGPYADGI